MILLFALKIKVHKSTQIRILGNNRELSISKCETFLNGFVMHSSNSCIISFAVKAFSHVLSHRQFSPQPSLFSNIGSEQNLSKVKKQSNQFFKIELKVNTYLLKRKVGR